MNLAFSAVFVVGVLYIFKTTLRVLKSLIPGSGVNLSKCGKWAVVTGCTDGIGKEYAMQLASKGLNICLVARNAELLQEISKDIEEKYKVKTKIIRQDIAQATAADYERIAVELNALEDIGILVNNVGLSYDHPEFFDQLPLAAHRNLLAVNCASMVELTHAVLPGMITRKRGIIVNLSSISGLTPCPLLATYSATKAFVATFSESLHSEYQCKGIIVQACTPAFVVSKMSKIKRSSLFTPTAATFVRSALASIGSGPVVCLPYWPHRLQALILTSVPDSVRDMYITRLHLKLRGLALKKKQKNG